MKQQDVHIAQVNFKKSYGLTLEGGGAKGAYHIGSYFALKEKGFEFDCVVGTSIGAINAAMIVSGEAHKCADLWRNTTMADYYNKEEVSEFVDKDTDKEDIVLRIKNLVSDTIAKAEIPIEPVRNLIEENIDEEKVRASRMKFGLVTVNLTDKKVEELFADEIPQGELKKYILASCYHPVFKMEPLDGKYYLDGGFANNIPYNMVQKLGLTPVIIRTNHSKVNNFYMPKDAIIIEPSKSYASVIDFDPVKADEIIRIAYFDTYKVLDGLMGNKYYIRPFSEEYALKILENIFFKEEEESKPTSKYMQFFEETLSNLAQKYDVEGEDNYSKLLLMILEKVAEEQKVEYLNIYGIDEFIEEIRRAEKTQEDKNSFLQKLAKRI
ncbi:MAG: patatin-like phospholipase family protein [Peptoniphilus sp.]|nr:patatin-like phospholipase family protein [Peptoniphilus sp.]